MKLKSCPFCGSKNINIVIGAIARALTYQSICLNCGISGLKYETQLKAIKKWNTRTPITKKGVKNERN
jgi:Lar family restriction alleviation protein